jgi:hypothetical protein
MFKVFSSDFDPTVNSPFNIFKRIFQNLNSCSGFGYSTRKLEMYLENLQRKLV